MHTYLDISLIPKLREKTGAKILKVEVEGDRLTDAINIILKKFGTEAKQALCDEKGNIDPVIKVIINNKDFIAKEKFDSTRIKEGDTIKIMPFFAGG